MSTQNSVFISYSRKDQEFVRQLSVNLRNEGFDLWIDVEQISGGVNWPQTIANRLKQSTVVIFVASKHSEESSWMTFEVSTFLSLGNIVIPIVIDDEGEFRMPERLKSIQWIDFRQDYAQALSLLSSSLSNFVQHGPATKPKKVRSKGYVFLSYAQEDMDFVSDLKGYLAKRSYAYWDYEESDRDYHSQLFLELEGVIKEASATLSILSESWKRSQWAIKEYLFSEEVGTPVFLLKVNKLEPTLVIAGVPFIDFVINPRLGFDKLDRELKRKGL